VKRIHLVAACLALALAACAPARAQDVEAAKRAAQEAEAKKKLDGVRAEIRALAEQQRAANGERDDASRALREKELALGSVAREVHALDERMSAQQQQLDELDVQRTRLDAKLKSQRDALGGLLRSAYALGHGEELKLLLQQDDVAAISRVWPTTATSNAHRSRRSSACLAT